MIPGVFKLGANYNCPTKALIGSCEVTTWRTNLYFHHSAHPGTSLNFSKLYSMYPKLLSLSLRRKSTTQTANPFWFLKKKKKWIQKKTIKAKSYKRLSVRRCRHSSKRNETQPEIWNLLCTSCKTLLLQLYGVCTWTLSDLMSSNRTLFTCTTTFVERKKSITNNTRLICPIWCNSLRKALDGPSNKGDTTHCL
jgi:hypothetical protein